LCYSWIKLHPEVRPCGQIMSCGPSVEERDRLRSQLDELEASALERDAADGVSLHNLQLQKLKYMSMLQRCEAQSPTLDDLVSHYEEEISEFTSEVTRLKKVNVPLCFGSQDPSPGTPCSGSRHRAPTVAEELLDTACALWPKHSAGLVRERFVQVAEWRLSILRSEALKVTENLRAAENRLEQLRGRNGKAETYLLDITSQIEKGEEELEETRSNIREGHREVLRLREACAVPTRMKRESSILIKLLDQDGGRLAVQKHRRSTELCKRLYEEVMIAAPLLQALVGCARADVEREFARYLRLKESHGLLLQKVQHAVTRGLLKDESVLFCRAPSGLSTRPDKTFE